MKFGENLKSIRNQRKISQEQLADKVGVSRQSVSKWETGEAYPEMNNILQLCKIFNCHINDLVHEDMSDINSLDREIKMSVVKFKKEQQKKMKGISKALYVIAKICKVCGRIALGCIIAVALIIPVITLNVNVKNNSELNIFGEKINYERNDKKIVLTLSDGDKKTINKRNDVKSINYVFDVLESNSKYAITIKFEIIMIFIIASVIFVVMSLKHIENLFKNIHDGNTPFTLENVDHIKKLTYLLIASFVVSLIGEGLIDILFNIDSATGIDTMNIMLILALFCTSYIFEYGYEIQKDSKGVMYGEE